jgi:hypothetical protein
MALGSLRAACLVSLACSRATRGWMICSSRRNLDRFPEDDGAQGLAIEGTIGIENGRAEGLDDGAPGRLARFHHLVGQRIGVDDERPASLEHLRYRALAGRDTAGEAHKDHGAGRYHGGRGPAMTLD